MRLINVETLQLESFYTHWTMPRYAILSHTWGEDEVLFRDMQPATEATKQKLGWKKIAHVCTQAKEDYLDYAWVDTCCIDKTSSAELSEAINSMFAWYQESAVCYVYLVDVDAAPVSTSGPFREAFQKQLRSSRWFKRGWTLQETIAPHTTEFFSKRWTRLGSLRDLGMIIAEVTTIPLLLLLRETKITSYCAARRMSWASQRKTTRIEDEAYCLLGLFQINLPLLYGERRAAFKRLQHEILRTSGDLSIFAWEQSNYFFLESGPLLAVGPEQFARSTYLRAISTKRADSITLLSQGARAVAPILTADPTLSSGILISLNCYDERSPDKVVALSTDRFRLQGIAEDEVFVVCEQTDPERRLRMVSSGQPWRSREVNLLYNSSMKGAQICHNLYIRVVGQECLSQYRVTLKDFFPSHRWHRHALSYELTGDGGFTFTVQQRFGEGGSVHAQAFWEFRVSLQKQTQHENPIHDISCTARLVNRHADFPWGLLARPNKTHRPPPMSSKLDFRPSEFFLRFASAAIFTGLWGNTLIRFQCERHLSELDGRDYTLFIILEPRGFEVNPLDLAITGGLARGDDSAAESSTITDGLPTLLTLESEGFCAGEDDDGQSEWGWRADWGALEG